MASFWLHAGLSLGCGGSQPEGQRAGGEQPAAVQPLHFDRGPQWREPYGKSPLWRRAALGDPIDLAHLAQRHTPESLVSIVGLGGPVGAVALRAVPYLHGNYEAGLRLCDLLPRVSGPSARSVLSTMVDSLQGGPHQESFDPARTVRCLERLKPWTTHREPLAPTSPIQSASAASAPSARSAMPTPIRDLATIVTSYLKP